MTAHAAEPAGDSPRRAVEAYFRAVDGARSADMPRAFHPSALMFWIAPGGALAVLAQPDWWARLDATKAPAPALRREVGEVLLDGDAALAFATARFPAYAFDDALLLLRLERGWRIVGKVFHRREPPDRAASAAAEPAVRATLAKLVAALDASDGDALAACALPRATFITALAGDAVPLSLVEQQARLAERRQKNEQAAAPRSVRDVRVLDDVAAARLARPGGVEHVLLVRAAGEWRVAAMTAAARP